MRIGSLFSGAGGLDMAVEAVFGGEVVWQAEIDKAASKVLAYRFPTARNLGDITAIDWDTVERVDVVCGGFPCQDVSAAGKRAGIKDGTRSGLWAIFAEAIDALRPQFVVIENVRGLLSATAHRAVESDDAVVGDGAGRPVLRAAGAVLGDLADIGYDAVWATVAAADVGAPHRRERVFIVGTAAHPGHDAGCAEQEVEHEKQARWAGETGHRDRGAAAADSADDQPLLAPRNAGHYRREGQPQSLDKSGARTSTRDSSGNPSARVQFVGRSPRIESHDASYTPGEGWDEGRPESARIVVGRSDAAVSGDEPGRVELLPTPCVVDRLATGEMTLEEWDESRRSQKERGVGSFGPRGDSLGAAILRVEEGTERPDYSTTKARRGADEPGVALLPTPAAGNFNDGEDADQWLARQAAVKERLNNGNGMGMPLAIAVQLLPTPTTQDAANNGGPSQFQRNTLPLNAEVTLLSTPQSRDYKGVPADNFNTANLCRDVAKAQDWGKYTPAIARWESLTRPAPPPTEPNKNGNPRLSAAFSEWLMGWPDGWVTDPEIGISRNDQLRIVGNGVCPQQAAAALRFLLGVSEVAA